MSGTVEAGHHYAISLEPDETIEFSLVATGHEHYGSLPAADVYDEDGVMVSERVLYSAAYGVDTDTGRYRNTTGPTQDFFVRMYNDMSLSILTELREYALTFRIE